MNAHSTNSVFHAVNKLAAPKFTRKLTYAEQEALNDADTHAYWDWLFGVNEAVCRRRERADDNALGHDEQQEYADRNQDYADAGGMKR